MKRKSTFQQELESKLKDRKRRGLASGFSDTGNEDDSSSEDDAGMGDGEFQREETLRKYCNPNLKISMFCAPSQNYQHFFEKIMHESKSNIILFKELKNDIEISVGQAVIKLWIKTVKIVF